MSDDENKNPFICDQDPKEDEICFGNTIIKIPPPNKPKYCVLNTDSRTYELVQKHENVDNYKLNQLCNSHTEKECTPHNTMNMCRWNAPPESETSSDHSWKIGVGIGVPAIIIGIILVVYFTVMRNKK